MFEDTKGVLRTRKSVKKTVNTMAKRKRINGKTTIYKTLLRKLKIEQHEPTLKPMDNSRRVSSSCSTYDTRRDKI